VSSDLSGGEQRSSRVPVLLFSLLILALMVVARKLFPVPLPHIQMPAEVLFVLPGNFGFTNTMLAILVTDVLLLVITFRVRRTLAMKPKGLANVIEAVVEFWQNQSVQMVGTELANRWLPLVLTVFLLIALSNWAELIPGYDTVGIACHECPRVEGGVEIDHTLFAGQDLGTLFLAKERLETTVENAADAGPVAAAASAEEAPNAAYAIVPFFRTATTDLNVTLALALIAFAVIEIAGFRALGFGYIRKFLNFKEGPLGIFVGLVEFISELSRIISFSFRLFGNLFAGQILLFVIPFLVPFLLPVSIYGLELFVGLIQGYVFAVLILAFMDSAVTAHQGPEHH
jgi:F-type H+-transporting ATPase subunit a